MSKWHTSSYSGGTNQCVEVREHTHGVDVRDTQNRDRGHLTIPTTEWTAFVSALKTEEL